MGFGSFQLRRMDMEARSFSQDKSQQLMRKVKEYKADLKKITDDSRQAQAAAGGTCACAAAPASHAMLSCKICSMYTCAPVTLCDTLCALTAVTHTH